MVDPETIATYNAKAKEYADLTEPETATASLQDFISLMPKGARVLDLGCGPGTSSAHMRDAGLNPDPLDASQGMIDIAKAKFGLDARLGTFDDIPDTPTYSGVWANFSLLHAPREDLPRHLTALHQATHANGILHIGMKTGEGMARDTINRRYTYVTVPELRQLLTDAGYEVNYTREGVGKGLSGTMDPYVVMRGIRR